MLKKSSNPGCFINSVWSIVCVCLLVLSWFVLTKKTQHWWPGNCWVRRCWPHFSWLLRRTNIWGMNGGVLMVIDTRPIISILGWSHGGRPLHCSLMIILMTWWMLSLVSALQIISDHSHTTQIHTYTGMTPKLVTRTGEESFYFGTPGQFDKHFLRFILHLQYWSIWQGRQYRDVLG